MVKLGDTVTYVTVQGQLRTAFISAEVVEAPQEPEESDAERQAREQAEAKEAERAEAVHAQREEEIAAEGEVAKATHEEAEARAGGPIQRIVLVSPTSTSVFPVPLVDEDEDEDEEAGTGPEVTLHALLHPSDHDFGTYGSIATYSGVKHSDKARPHTWH